MKFILLFPNLLICIVQLSTAGSPHDWEAFKKFHRKSYPSIAHEQGAQVQFELTKERIDAHAKKHQAGRVTYILALNEFADEDLHEFWRVRNGGKLGNRSNHVRSSSSPPQSGPAPSIVPAGMAGCGFDWRTKGVVSAVRNQGQCGSCWAFSAVGAIESQVLKNGGPEVGLSEEQLLDCDSNDIGCQGGNVVSAFQWFQNNGGVDSLSSYPYTAQSGQKGKCRQSTITPVQNVTGSQSLPTPAGKEEIQRFLKHNGPCSVGVYAGAGSAWDSQYSGGILSSSNQEMDHFVLLVGWGSDQSGFPYWIIKNSWGTGWGMQGFAYLAVGDQDSGLSQYFITYPTTQ